MGEKDCEGLSDKGARCICELCTRGLVVESMQPADIQHSKRSR